MATLLAAIMTAVRAAFMGRQTLIFENLDLRQQLAFYKRIGKRARLSRSERIFWVWLSKLWDNWRSALIVVKPETVIGWHRQGYRLYSNNKYAKSVHMAKVRVS